MCMSAMFACQQHAMGTRSSLITYTVFLHQSSSFPLLISWKEPFIDHLPLFALVPDGWVHWDL